MLASESSQRCIYVEYSLENSFSFWQAWIMIWKRVLIRLYKGKHSFQPRMTMDLNTLLTYWFKKDQVFEKIVNMITEIETQFADVFIHLPSPDMPFCSLGKDLWMSWWAKAIPLRQTMVRSLFSRLLVNTNCSRPRTATILLLESKFYFAPPFF